jgi:hypothetical protein
VEFGELRQRLAAESKTLPFPKSPSTEFACGVRDAGFGDGRHDHTSSISKMNIDRSFVLDPYVLDPLALELPRIAGVPHTGDVRRLPR